MSKAKPAPPVLKPIVFERANPFKLALFNPDSKQCTMNCGPHRDDPRSYAERKFLCDDCFIDRNFSSGVMTLLTENLTAMNKRIKKMKDMLDQAGLTVVEFIGDTNGVIKARANAGTEITRVFSITMREGDPRGDQNELSRMRRFYREIHPYVDEALPTQMAEKLKPVVEEFKHVAAVAPPPTPEPESADEYLKGIHERDQDRELPAPPETPPETPAEAAQRKLSNLEKARAVLAAKREELKRLGKPVGWGGPKRKKAEHTQEEKPMPRAKPVKSVRPAKSEPQRTLPGMLSLAKQYEGIEWLKKADMSQFGSMRAVNVALTEALKTERPISMSTITNMMEVAGVAIEAPKRDYVRAAPIIAAELVRLMEHLGETPSNELLMIAKDKT